MVISIPIIVLRKASFGIRQKLSIAFVLCLSLFMIIISLIRGISLKAYGAQDQSWNLFWIQLEASISVIAACPAACRTFFLSTHSQMNDSPHENIHQPRNSVRQPWKRTKPNLPSIHVRATIQGMSTIIRDCGNTQLRSLNDHEDAPARHIDHDDYLYSVFASSSRSTKSCHDEPGKDLSLV